jgi:hypothetical protein
MISAVTAKGAMYFTTFTGKMTADVFIAYCRDLLHDDGASSSSSSTDTLSTAVAQSKSSPPQPTANFTYSSSHPTHQSSTPTNGSGRTSNMTASVRTAITSFDDLRDKAESALLRLQRLPELVRAFFRDPCLSYIK